MSKITKSVGPRNYKEELEYAAESLLFEVQEILAEQLEHRQMTKAELARRLGVAAPRITNLLRAESNLTVRTLGRVLYALDVQLSLKITEGHRVSLAFCDGTSDGDDDTPTDFVRRPQSSDAREAYGSKEAPLGAIVAA